MSSQPIDPLDPGSGKIAERLNQRRSRRAEEIRTHFVDFVRIHLRRGNAKSVLRTGPLAVAGRVGALDGPSLLAESLRFDSELVAHGRSDEIDFEARDRILRRTFERDFRRNPSQSAPSRFAGDGLRRRRGSARVGLRQILEQGVQLLPGELRVRQSSRCGV